MNVWIDALYAFVNGFMKIAMKMTPRVFIHIVYDLKG